VPLGGLPGKGLPWLGVGVLGPARAVRVQSGGGDVAGISDQASPVGRANVGGQGGRRRGRLVQHLRSGHQGAGECDGRGHPARSAGRLAKG
jgi:hypothetical protein